MPQIKLKTHRESKFYEFSTQNLYKMKSNWKNNVNTNSLQGQHAKYTTYSWILLVYTINSSENSFANMKKYFRTLCLKLWKIKSIVPCSILIAYVSWGIIAFQSGVMEFFFFCREKKTMLQLSTQISFVESRTNINDFDSVCLESF